MFLIYILSGSAVFVFIFWIGKWVIHILAISYGKYKLHKKKNISGETSLPSVSILKPLMGVDPHLSQNLETFFTMKYPVYELLFCIEDQNDPAVEVVKILCKKYPNIESFIFIGGSRVGVNPKINNMHPGYQFARYDLIMISDSGIKMKEDTLLDMVEHMTEKVGLVHQMPFTCDRDSFAATFEKIFFGTIQSRIYLCADLFGINCHTGMSCLIRKSVLDDLGGLSKFGCYLAEDFFLAKSLMENGWKICISSQPAMQNSGICDIQSFQARLCRWTKLRVAMVPTMILLEPLSECLIIGALASCAVSFLFNWDPIVFYSIHILVWFMSDWILLSIVQNGSLTFSKIDFVIGWAFREVFGPYIFLNAIYNPEIEWRKRFFKLHWGGKAYEIIKSDIQNKIDQNDDDNNPKYNQNSNLYESKMVTDDNQKTQQQDTQNEQIKNVSFGNLNMYTINLDKETSLRNENSIFINIDCDSKNVENINLENKISNTNSIISTPDGNIAILDTKSFISSDDTSNDSDTNEQILASYNNKSKNCNFNISNKFQNKHLCDK